MKDSIVVLDAGGGLGHAIVAELLAAGHSVVAVTQDADGLAALAPAGGHLSILPGSVATDGEAAALVADLRRRQVRPKAVVALVFAIGASVRLLDQPGEFLRQALDETLVRHFVAARHLLPMLAELDRDGKYVILTGPTADCAWAGYGHRSVAAAALRMLTVVLREEAKTMPVRVVELQVGGPVRTGAGHICECPEWMSAADVGRRVASLVDEGGSEDTVRIEGYDRTLRVDAGPS